MSDSELWCYGNEDGYRGPVESREVAIQMAREETADGVEDWTHVAKVRPILWSEAVKRVSYRVWDHVMDELGERVGYDVLDGHYTELPELELCTAIESAIATAIEQRLGPVKVFDVRDPEPLPDDEGVTS